MNPFDASLGSWGAGALRRGHVGSLQAAVGANREGTSMKRRSWRQATGLSYAFHHLSLRLAATVMQRCRDKAHPSTVQTGLLAQGRCKHFVPNESCCPIRNSLCAAPENLVHSTGCSPPRYEVSHLDFSPACRPHAARSPPADRRPPASWGLICQRLGRAANQRDPSFICEYD